MTSKIWGLKADGTKGPRTPDEVSTRIDAVPPLPPGNGNCTRMTLRAGEEQPHEQSGQPAWVAVSLAKLTGRGVAGGGAALMFADTSAGLERAFGETEIKIN
jgi:hypothetical protein